MENNLIASKNLKQLEIEYKYGVRTRMDRSQRITDHPTDPDLENTEIGTEIFMASLPRNALEDVLFPVFSSVGPIRQMRIMMEFSGVSRGFGFVRYYDCKSASLALAKLKNSIICGKCIQVHLSFNNCKLSLSDIPHCVTMDKLANDILTFFTGVETINKQRAVKGKPHSVIVSFETHRYALEARKAVWPDKFIISGAKISVEWAKPFQRKIT